ncbi:MAG: gene transfer agent family protein [Rhodobacteraceae bacterium]|nr:gene transfer agent family protein [Paracoccaceae bacterium]
MSDYYGDFAGENRRFYLSFGNILDLEEACGKTGFGAIYLRLSTHSYFVKDVYHTILNGLIGGGLKAVEARRLMDDRFDAMPMVERVELALNILMARMSGIEPDENQRPGDPEQPHDAGAIFAAFSQSGIGADVIRAMDYGDFIKLVRALGGNTVQPPSEEEFLAHIANLKG